MNHYPHACAVPGPVPRRGGRARLRRGLAWVAVGLGLAGISPPLAAQTVSFGKNKIQYKNFQWRVLESEHFHLYFYPREEALADTALAYAETAYAEVSARFRHEITSPIPLIIYSSHQDFEQTNVSPYFLPEGVAGFTEFLKGRVAMPFNGSYADFHHTLKHEIVHVFQLSRLDESLRLHYRNTLVSPPLWFTEGMADAWSSSWDGIAEVFVQDMVINGRVPDIQDLWQLNGTFTIYKVGQQLVYWLEANYGSGFIPRVYDVLWRYPSFEQAMAAVAGVPLNELNARWHYDLEKKYLPRVTEFEPVTLAARPVATKGPNFKPVVPPEGSGLDPETFYFLSPRTGYTNIYRASYLDREKDVEEIVEGQRSAEFESFHPFQSKMDLSRDGRLVFVSKFHERDGLFLYDIRERRVVGRWQFKNLVTLRSPTLNPQGTEVIFSGLSENGRQDLYRFAFGGTAVHPLTDDAYQDDDPEWSPDGRHVVFVSDRTRWGGETKNLYLLDLETGKLSALTDGPWVDGHPAYNADGKRLAFSSDRSGTPQIHVADSTGVAVRVTAILGMAGDPVWLPGDHELLFTVMADQQFGIYRARVGTVADTVTSESPVIADAPDTTAASGDVAAAKVAEALHPVTQVRRTSRADSLFTRERPFHSRFSLDFAVGGVAFEPTQNGVGQGLQALLSDQLGDRLIFLQVANTAQEFGDVLTRMSVGGTYYDLSHRLNRGVSLYNFVGDYIDELGFRYYERRVGGSAIVSYPYSKFFRVEGSTGLLYSDRGPDSFRPARKGWLVTNYLSLIEDTSLWLNTGPIDGARYNLTVGLTTNIEKVELENVALVLDLRRYFRTGLRTAYAVRLQSWLSQGSFPERYVLGGSWSLRGYPRRSLVGTRAVLLNQEWRFPLLYGAALGLPIGTIGLPPVTGAFFLDAGQAWEEGEGLDRVAGSFGLGLRTNFGGLMVLRLDICRRTDFRRVFPDTEVDFFVGFDY